MKKVSSTKKAASSIIIAICIVIIISGAATIGILLSIKNNQPTEQLSYQEALEIACNIPEVAVFIENNDLNKITGEIVDDTWVIEFQSDNITYANSKYVWILYAYVEIDANTGEVLYFVVQTPKDPTHTEQEIINIACDFQETLEWTMLYFYSEKTATYDGYLNWHVMLFHESTGSYAHIIISDENESMLYFETYSRWPGASHTIEEIEEITEALPEVIDWKTENPEYDMCTGFKEGIWKTQYIRVDRLDFINIHINDSTLEVVLIEYYQDKPSLTEAEVVAIAAAIPEIASYLATVPYTIYTDFYEGVGNWLVQFRHEFIHDEYAEVSIKDLTGEVLSYEIVKTPDPIMKPEEVWAIVLGVEEINNWTKLLLDNQTSCNFVDGEWHVSITAGNLTLNSVGLSIIAYHVVIDDATGDILSITTTELSLKGQIRRDAF